MEASIQARLDAVEELINSEDRFTKLRESLKGMNKMDFDKLIVALASSEAKETLSAKPASQRVSQMLNLRNVVRNLPFLQKALVNTKSQLLKIIYEVFCYHLSPLLETTKFDS